MIMLLVLQGVSDIGLTRNASAEARTPINLAVNKPTTASSISAANYSSSQVVDGVYHDGTFNPSIEFSLWTNDFSSVANSTGAWLQIDLGETSELHEVKVQYRGLTGTYIGLSADPVYFHMPKNVTIQTSDDGSEWDTLISKAGDLPANRSSYAAGFISYPLPEDSMGRYVRLLFEEGAEDLTLDNGALSIVEVQVMGNLPPSSENDILSFSSSRQVEPAIIDSAAHTVELTLRPNSNLTAVTPSIEVSPRASILPASGQTVDFTAPVTYTVTAEDGTTQEWLVTATMQSIPIQAEYYVSPDGDDSNPGTLNEPFLTITKAQDVVRTINEDMTGDIVIYLRGGDYPVSAALSFNAADSGSNDYRVIYKAYEDEKPVISGGKKVEGWNLYDADKGIWSVSVPDIDDTRQLYINGQLETIARGPIITTSGWNAADDPDLTFHNLKETFTTYQGSLSVYEGYKTTAKYKDMINWRNHSQIELIYDVGWTHSILPVQSIVDAGDGVGAIIQMKSPAFRDAQIKDGVHINDPNYFQNAYELLDEPGEWYLDRPAHQLYYIPRANVDMGSVEAIVPRVEQLLELTGTLDQPVHHLSFEGISFEYTTFLRPSQLGHAEIQANMIKDPNNDQFLTSYLKTPGGIVLRAAQHIIFENNTLSKFGAAGIDIEHGSSNNLILGSAISEIAGSGIQIGGFLPADSHPDDLREVVANNTISNNFLNEIGVEYKGGIGIFVGYAAGTVITHNDISDIAYTGVSVGWGWGYYDQGGRSESYTSSLPRFSTPSIAHSNEISYNHIYRVTQKLHDGGGIYTLSMMPNSQIKGNLVHDNSGWPGGIYLDEGSGGITVTNNVVYGTALGYFYHAAVPGKQETNTVTNNYFDVAPTSSNYPVAIAEFAGLESDYQHLLAVLPVRLDSISNNPLDGAGSKITIGGSQFGTAPGSVTFTGSDGPIVVDGSGIVSWSNTRVEVTLPQGVKSGSVYLTTANGSTSNKDKEILLLGPPNRLLFEDDFDSYEIGALPNERYDRISSGNFVTDTDAVSGGQSMELLGGKSTFYKTAQWKNSLMTFSFKFNSALTSYEGIFASAYSDDPINPSADKYYFSINPAFGADKLMLQTYAGGAYTKAASKDQATNIGTWYTAKSLLLNNVMYLKVWPMNEEEPDQWDIQAQLSGLSAGGGLNIEFYAASDTKTALIDDVHVLGWDMEPPVTAVSISGEPTNGWYSSEVDVTLSATDELSTVASTQYQLIADGDSPVEEDYMTYENPIQVAEGTHALYFRSTDAEGNKEAAQSTSIKVDTTSPSVEVTLNGNTLTNNAEFTNAASLLFKVAAVDALSGVHASQITVGGQAYTLGQEMNLSGKIGTHSVQISVTDQAGNVVTRTLSLTIKAQEDPNPPSGNTNGNNPGGNDQNTNEDNDGNNDGDGTGGDSGGNTGGDHNFNDISGHWAAASIQQAVSKGIITGYGDNSVRPNAPATRAELAIMIVRALNPQANPTSSSLTYSDSIPKWAEGAIHQMIQSGIMQGYSDGSIRPQNTVSRTELIVMLVRALGLKVDAEAETTFSDNDSIPRWARGYVTAAVEAGLVSGTGNNTFSGARNATRAEVVTLLLRATEYAE